MTVNSLIEQLQAIVDANPEKGEMGVYVYPLEELDTESPNPIDSIDDGISDRVDINVNKDDAYYY